MTNLATSQICTENDYVVEPHFLGFQAKKFFANGFGVSIIPEVGSVTNFKSLVERRGNTLGDEQYEVAVLHQVDGNWKLCYNTPITDDVIRCCSLQEVLDIVKEVEKLPPRGSEIQVSFYTEEMAAEDDLLLSGVSPDEEWRLK